MTYTSGDIVRLKSGGPKMTVLSTDGDAETFACEWFDRNGKLHRDSFQGSSLEAFVARPARPEF